MAAAIQLTPVFLRAVNEIAPIGKRAHERDREPVAYRLAHTNLILDVVSEMRQRVSLGRAAVVGYLFIAAGERDGLEREEGNLLWIVESELDYLSHLFIINAVDDCSDRHNLNSIAMEVFDRAQLHVKEVADFAVFVSGVADAVELKIGIPEPRFGGLLTEIRTLGEFDSICSRLNAVESDFARVGDGVEKVWRERRLAARKLHRHLPPWLDRDRVIQERLDVLPRQFVDEADLIRVHETGVAHHIASVCKVDGEHRSAAVLDRAAAVIVQSFVAVRANVAARKYFLEVLEKIRVDRHNVFEMSVNRAVLHH